MRISRLFLPYLIVLVSGLLSACGGGGGGGATSKDLKVNTTSVTFNAIVNGATPPSQDYQVSWSRSDVAAVLIGYPPTIAIPSWLTITAPNLTTPATSPITMNLSVYTGSLSMGTYTTTVRIISQATNGKVIDIVDIPVTLNVGDTVSTSPSSVEFLTTIGMAPAINLKTVNLVQSSTVLTPTGASVSAGASWLQANINNNDIQISTTNDALALSAGIYNASVTITDPSGSISVPVSLTVSQRPFSFVSPYTGTTGVASDVIIRGSGFQGISAPIIKFGAYAATSSSVVSDTEIHATYPAMPKGTYPITISGSGGDILLNAKLVILDPPAYSDSTVNRLNSGNISGMVYDAERNSLYIADHTNGVVERYHYDGMQWNADELSVPSVKGIALTPDGIELLAMSDDNVVHIDCDSFAITATIPAPYASNISTAGSTNLNHVAIANDGMASIMTEMPCCTSSYDSGYSYNILTRTFTTIPSNLLSSDQDVAATGDGSRVIAVGHGGSPSGHVYYYDASSQTYIGTSLYQNASMVIANTDGTRWLDDANAVYDDTFSQVGNLTSALYSAYRLVGSNLYVYADSDGLLHKYDVTSANSSGGFDEVGIATSIAAAPLGSSYVTPYMAVTPDGSKLFIASTNKIQIISSP